MLTPHHLPQGPASSSIHIAASPKRKGVYLGWIATSCKKTTTKLNSRRMVSTLCVCSCRMDNSPGNSTFAMWRNGSKRQYIINTKNPLPLCLSAGKYLGINPSLMAPVLSSLHIYIIGSFSADKLSDPDSGIFCILTNIMIYAQITLSDSFVIKSFNYSIFSSL